MCYSHTRLTSISITEGLTDYEELTWQNKSGVLDAAARLPAGPHRKARRVREEIIFRKRVSTAFQERVTQMGFYFLMALMVLVVFNDLVNFGVFAKIKSLVSASFPTFGK